MKLLLHADCRFDDGEQLWIAEVQELQGCWASGRTEEELDERLKLAITDYLEIFGVGAYQPAVELDMDLELSLAPADMDLDVLERAYDHRVLCLH